jgi:hypothetical protein
MTKNNEIISTLNESRQKFLQSISGLTDVEMLRSGVVGEWSIKDLLSHLSLWEAELVKLLWQLRQRQKPDSLHFQKDFIIDEINARWYQENRDRPLERVLADFHAVRKQTIRQIESFREKDLSDPGAFKWLGDSPLENWIGGDSYLHEAEHTAQILTWRSHLGKS